MHFPVQPAVWRHWAGSGRCSWRSTGGWTPGFSLEFPCRRGSQLSGGTGRVDGRGRCSALTLSGQRQVDGHLLAATRLLQVSARWMDACWSTHLSALSPGWTPAGALHSCSFWQASHGKLHIVFNICHLEDDIYPKFAEFEFEEFVPFLFVGGFSLNRFQLNLL
ncbi:hypothetical protein AAFF_G00350300 [Aldrovandia affinis]|uniref:Uncharacterized protein n=1 Tax=Aldrovandia affinis TaxID=143900 RepID=A0AAD7VZP4_9TELE|nr:hypothetical protein AAFF_G00350300 [Aldrovandia affinis]